VNYTSKFCKIFVSYTFYLNTGNNTFIRKYSEGYALMCVP